MKVAGIQTDLAWEDPERNFRNLARSIEQAALAGAQFIALPETFPTGFSLDSSRIAEEDGGPAHRFLQDQARSHGVALCGSVATKRGAGEKPYNLGVVAFPDGKIERYAKIHPFTFGGEPEHYSRGDRTLTFCVAGVRVTLLICYDLRFGEIFAALAKRTDLFCVIANWPERRRDHWRTLLKARSIECLAYVLGVNRVGTGGQLSYMGDSALWAPGGHLIHEGRPGIADMIVGEIDPERVATARQAFPVLDDRRPDLYRGL